VADMFEGFVEVYSTATGTKQMVPEHYLDNPVLMAGFTQTPSSRAAAEVPTPEAGNTFGQAADLVPSGDWKVAELQQFATENDVDLGGATLKADILAAITEHLAAGEATTQTAADAGNTEGA
jgi:hypothetical protein